MPPTDSRALPLASIRLFEKGQGDPVVTDHGFAWYDSVAETWQYGTFSRDTSGKLTLEYLPEVGIVCRPFLVLQDTRLANYATSGGSWEECKPATGTPRKWRLIQVDTSVGIQWSATSSFPLLADPHVAFSLIFVDGPADWDEDAYPRFVRVEFGGGLWAIQFSQADGTQLVRWASGQWQAVMDVPEPTGYSHGENDERLILLRCLRGRIGVSTDFGRSYRWHGSADGTPLTVESGAYTVRGQGGMCVFGLHQLRYYSGTYTSPPRNTFQQRLVGAGAMVTGRASVPTGTTVIFADVSTPAAATAQYRATLTPVAVAGVPFTFYRTPELYAALLEYPVVTGGGTGFYTTPWDGAIQSVRISKPYELDTGSAAVRIRKEAGEQLVWASGRFPKVQILLGEASESGAESWWTAFTGYVSAIRCRAEEYGESDLSLEVENLSHHFKRTEWTKQTSRPLGGRTLNQALDLVLQSEGLDASYRAWHALGDTVTLPQGSPEDPFEWPKPGERKWATLARLAGYWGLEIGVTDSGGLFTAPKEFYQPWVSRVWEADPATDLKALVRGVTFGLDCNESATAALVEGTAESGEQLLAWAVDGAAEGNPASARFCPWREVVQEELSATVAPGMLIARAQALARELFSLKLEPDLTLPVDLSVSRREQVRITGLKVGIADWDRFVVLSLEHVYEADPSFARLSTTAGLRRLN